MAYRITRKLIGHNGWDIQQAERQHVPDTTAINAAATTVLTFYHCCCDSSTIKAERKEVKI